jgi:peptidoglycan/LPS O-acetylase OafA/YrhL
MAARPLQFIGERSYSVYLVHAPTVYYLTPVYRLIYRHVPIEGLAYLMCAALGVSCVLLVASITYALVEARGIRAGTALIRTGRPQKGNRTPITAVDHPTELNIKYNVS